MMTKPMTIEDHQNSRMISDPFRLYDCSLESDGARPSWYSAERARDLAKPRVEVLGFAEGHPDSPSAITQRPDLTRLGIAKARRVAFGMAGVSPADIDVAEIYDCFTYIVMCQLEDLGFCKKGEGGPFVASGDQARRPVADQHPRRPALASAHGRAQSRGGVGSPAAR